MYVCFVDTFIDVLPNNFPFDLKLFMGLEVFLERYLALIICQHLFIMTINSLLMCQHTNVLSVSFDHSSYILSFYPRGVTCAKNEIFSHIIVITTVVQVNIVRLSDDQIKTSDQNKS